MIHYSINVPFYNHNDSLSNDNCLLFYHINTIFHYNVILYHHNGLLFIHNDLYTVTIVYRSITMILHSIKLAYNQTKIFYCPITIVKCPITMIHYPILMIHSPITMICCLNFHIHGEHFLYKGSLLYHNCPLSLYNIPQSQDNDLLAYHSYTLSNYHGPISYSLSLWPSVQPEWITFSRQYCTLLKQTSTVSSWSYKDLSSITMVNHAIIMVHDHMKRFVLPSQFSTVAFQLSTVLIPLKFIYFP